MLAGEGNDYGLLVHERDEWTRQGVEFHLPVSVILPVFNRKQILAKTLAALTHQTYPLELLEVVIADDGSRDGVEEVIARYRRYFSIRHAFQEDRGFRLAAVRNLAIRRASHDHFVLLDCDMLPDPELISSYMRFLHVTEQALLIGHRRFVFADNLEETDILEDVDTAISLPDVKVVRPERGVPTADWRLRVYQQTDDLRQARFPFSVCTGCNLGFSRSLYEQAGPYCERFQHWGGEDVEWAYRVYRAGFYFIPVLSAIALHQEPPGGENETDRAAGRFLTRPLLQSLCPLKYRKEDSDKIFEVPKVTVFVPAGEDSGELEDRVRTLFQQTFTDYEVIFVAEQAQTLLAEPFRRQPRVRWPPIQSENVLPSEAKGAYVLQLEIGERLLPESLGQLVKLLDSNNKGLVRAPEDSGPSGNELSQGKREGASTQLPAFQLVRARDWLRADRAGYEGSLSGLSEILSVCECSGLAEDSQEAPLTESSDLINP